MTGTLPAPRLVPRDVDALARRARALATGDARADDGAGLARLVAFRLAGAPCAVDAAVVERAVARLPAPIAVPLADGRERAVAFVDERPVPIADLAGTVAGAPRAAEALGGSPAIVVSTAAGGVAVAVDGPVELSEARVSAAAPDAGGATDRPRLAGRLDDGASVIDPGWLSAWAGAVAAP